MVGMTFTTFLHYLYLLADFVLAGYALWFPVVVILHDWWLDRYRVQQILAAEYRQGAYRRIEEDLQQIVEEFCESASVQLRSRIQVRVLNSLNGPAFSVGSDVFASARPRVVSSPDFVGNDERDLELQVIDGDHHCRSVCGRCDCLEDCLSRWAIASLSRIVQWTTWLDRCLGPTLFPDHPYLTSPLPVECVLGIAPTILNEDRPMSMWLLKRRVYFIKYNINMLRGLLMLLTFLFMIVWNAVPLLQALSFQTTTLYVPLRLVAMLASIPLVMFTNEWIHNPFADLFANQHSTNEELRGAIRYIDGESSQNDVCQWLCWFVFSGIALHRSRANAVVRIAKIKLMLQSRGESVTTATNNDDGNELHQRERTRTLLNQQILTAMEERKFALAVFASPLDRRVFEAPPRRMNDNGNPDHVPAPRLVIS
jgi:hypothetical protein